MSLKESRFDSSVGGRGGAAADSENVGFGVVMGGGGRVGVESGVDGRDGIVDDSCARGLGGFFLGVVVDVGRRWILKLPSPGIGCFPPPPLMMTWSSGSKGSMAFCKHSTVD